MSEQVSNEIPNAPLESSHVAAAERPLTGSPSRSRNKIRARIVQVVAVVVLVLLLVLLWRFLGNQAGNTNTRGAGRGESVPVEVAAVVQQDIPVQIKAIGNVEPLSTIAVRSQVEGTLLRVAFVPGQEVKRGDVLFVIDPRPLQSALSQAEANLLKAMAAVRQGNDIVARDQATAANDKVIVNRDLRLVEAGVIPREQYDNRSEERRVGKECRSRWGREHDKR